jgi:predicted ATPase
LRKLQTLIQIAQRNADERQVEVAGIETAIVEARRQVEAHDAAVAETELAWRDRLALAAFGLALRQARRRRQQLSDLLGQLERAGAAARAALHAAHAELKRLRLAAGAGRKRAARPAPAGTAEQKPTPSRPLRA